VQERYAEFQHVCRTVGRDPATIELTAGTVVRLSQAGEEQGAEKVITGTPEEVANRLRGFADVGVRHLMIVLEPSGIAPIEQFSRVLELLRSWSV
jgi:alkanesulfonate monooxygenase SsuD/methylene tetrahydromethanopterin reductase-like flavin-dependent oxidoreductase (luciferase family)